MDKKAPEKTKPRYIPDILDQQQALQILVDSVIFAQSKGIFSLDDAELANKAIRAFLPPIPVESPNI